LLAQVSGDFLGGDNLSGATRRDRVFRLTGLSDLVYFLDRTSPLMVPSMLSFWVLATFLFSDLLAGHGVLASLYPTKPVASTIYIAGQAAEVSWTEDLKTPLLNATAGLRIDLYAGNNVSEL
jgi:hypothetical protein